MFGNVSGNNSCIYEQDWSKFDWENFIVDYFSVDWEDLWKADELNVDNSTRMYLDMASLGFIGPPLNLALAPQI